MNFSKLKEACFQSDIHEVELYTLEEEGIEISTFDGAIDNNKSFATKVLAIRGVYKNQIVTIYEENDSDDVIPQIVEKIKDNCSIKDSKDPYFIFNGSKSYPTIVEKETDFSTYTIEDKVKLCFQIEEYMKKESSFVVKTDAGYEERKRTIRIENSNGLSLSRTSNSAVLYASCICKNDKQTETGFDYVIIKKVKDLDLPSMAKKIVEKAVSSLGADSIASSVYPVVLDKKVVASLLQAFSSVFSAESVIKNMSFLKDKINQKVFGENITLWDDPLNDEAIEQTTFDDEGVACKKKVVVENGVLKTYLHNLKTAAMMTVESTGNGFKGNVDSSIGVAPRNFYLKPGMTSFDDLLKITDQGVYITTVTGLHAGLNPVSGNFNLQSKGFLIEDGRITKPVTLIIISGSFQDLFNKVTHIGSDFEFRSNVGAPSIAISGLAISGK